MPETADRPTRPTRRPRPARLCVAALLAASAAGCAPAAAPPPAPPAELSGPGLPLVLPRTGAAARTLLERVAAGCWLDGIVGGGAMVVDRRTGRVVITSETEDLLVAELIAAGDGTSIVRLTGPAADDPAMALELSKALQTAVTTGRTSCPPLTSPATG